MSVLIRISLICAALAVAGCSGNGSGLGSLGSGGSGSGSIGSGGGTGGSGNSAAAAAQQDVEPKRETIWDLFTDATDPDREINVNKHLWAASLDVLSFLPVEAADPFSGVIVTGWGRINGTSTPYRATVYITEAALDARSLRVAVFRQSGGGAAPVSDEVARQIEDAILTRARQLRIAEAGR